MPSSEDSKELRPQKFSDFLGQEKNLERLQIVTSAAKKRGDALPHILLSGPPGLGKTTLSHILANEMGVNCHTVSAPAVEKPADLVGVLTQLENREVIFIDEIHRLPSVVEEFLYSAMEDRVIDITLDSEDTDTKTVRIPLNQFTLVGATTRQGMLTSPLLMRFGLKLRLNPYTLNELELVVARNAPLFNLNLDSGVAPILAKSCRGTPRILNNQLAFLRDYAQTQKAAVVGTELTGRALELLGVAPCGLDEMDQQYLQLLQDVYLGGPAGLESMAVALGEEAHTLAEVHEPYLIKQGLIHRGPRGRMLTDQGKKLVASRFGLL